MAGETNLEKLLKSLNPVHVKGDYVYCSVVNLDHISIEEVMSSCKEAEGISIVVKKEYADKMNLPYSSVLAWITLTVHSSIDAIGMTAAFSKVLAENNISCNVVAAFYHDHIFVAKGDVQKAIDLLKNLSK